MPTPPDISPARIRRHAEHLRNWLGRQLATPNHPVTDASDLLDAIATRDEARAAEAPGAGGGLSLTKPCIATCGAHMHIESVSFRCGKCGAHETAPTPAEGLTQGEREAAIGLADLITAVLATPSFARSVEWWQAARERSDAWTNATSARAATAAPTPESAVPMPRDSALFYARNLAVELRAMAAGDPNEKLTPYGKVGPTVSALFIADVLDAVAGLVTPPAPSPARAPERTVPRPLFDIVAERCEPAIDKVDCATWDGAYGAHQRISALIRVLDEERTVSPGEARAEGGEGGR